MREELTTVGALFAGWRAAHARANDPDLDDAAFDVTLAELARLQVAIATTPAESIADLAQKFCVWHGCVFNAEDIEGETFAMTPFVVKEARSLAGLAA